MREPDRGVPFGVDHFGDPEIAEDFPVSVGDGLGNDGGDPHFGQRLDDEDTRLDVFADAHHRHVDVLRADGFQRALVRGVALDRKGRNITDGLNFRLFTVDGEDFTALLHQRFRDAIAESAQADDREQTFHGCIPLI